MDYKKTSVSLESAIKIYPSRFKYLTESQAEYVGFTAGYNAAINDMIEANKMPLSDNSALIRELIAQKEHNATSAARAIGINPRNMRKYCNGLACSGLVVFLLENMQIKD
jgi:hypothetical protein